MRWAEEEELLRVYKNPVFTPGPMSILRGSRRSIAGLCHILIS